MPGKYLVVLKEDDRVGEIVPALERIVSPGAKVTFLLSYPVDAWSWLRDHWVVTESVRKAVSKGKSLLAQYSWEEQTRLAEKRIVSAREVLEKMGIEVTVILKGGFSRALREYVSDPDFQLLLISTANGSATIELVRLVLVSLRRIKRRGFVSFIPYGRRGEVAGR
jgi:predicted amino acid dehydrogenase